MLLLALAGCAPKSPLSPPAPGSRDPCQLAADSAERLDTFTVALPDSIDLAHAPQPTNEGERLLFRQLFETLVRLDCQGEIRPGLATTWFPDSTGRIWTFVLRSGTSFPDGSALTTTSVVSSWRSRWPALQAVGLDSIKALDEQRLVVTVRDRRDSLPHLFADPLLSVTNPAGSAAASHGGMAVALASGPPVLAAEVSPNGDLRDALDSGADLVISGDPAVIEYASARSEFETFLLPWSRTYALLQRAGTEAVEGKTYDDSVRQSLARDAVQTEARPTRSPYWWTLPCAASTSNRVTVPLAARILYPRNDRVARQLAERIIALAGDSLQLRAVGLGPAAFADALEKGTDHGYIVALPFRPVSPCREAAQWTGGTRIEPLIDTRARAIVRRGSPPLTVDWDGIVRILYDDIASEVRP